MKHSLLNSTGRMASLSALILVALMILIFTPLSFARADHPTSSDTAPHETSGDRAVAVESKEDVKTPYSSIRNLFQSRNETKTEVRDAVLKTEDKTKVRAVVTPIIKDTREETRSAVDATRATVQQNIDRTHVLDQRVEDAEKRAVDVRDKVEVKAQDARDKAEARAQEAREKAEAKTLEAREKVQERKADAEEKRVEKKRELTQKAKERVDAYFSKVMERLSAALDRMNTLADRIESRLEKLAERGVDITHAEALLKTARIYITDGYTAIEEARLLSVDVTEAQAPQELFAQAKQTIRTVVDSIQKAHRALVDAIAATKASIKIESDTATDTSEEKASDDDEE